MNIHFSLSLVDVEGLVKVIIFSVTGMPLILANFMNKTTITISQI